MKKKPVKVEESIVAIDKDELDEEWVNQPSRYFKYAKMLAKAKKVHDERKAEKDLSYAECEQAIRSDPDAYNLSKTTEAAIKAAILEHPEYQLANKRLISAKYDVDVLEAAVKALDHRKSALENLVYLHGQSYFSSPRDRTGTMKEVKQKKLSDRIRLKKRSK